MCPAAPCSAWVTMSLPSCVYSQTRVQTVAGHGRHCTRWVNPGAALTTHLGYTSVTTHLGHDAPRSRHTSVTTHLGHDTPRSRHTSVTTHLGHFGHTSITTHLGHLGHTSVTTHLGHIGHTLVTTQLGHLGHTSVTTHLGLDTPPEADTLDTTHSLKQTRYTP